jgi:DNA mismatch repair ATPase MutS
VSNDVAFPEPGRALLITGSNMSGKSTLLRATGINAVLAQAGAPVCASRLRMSSLAVRTSMRIDDSLEQGISHFYAELARLKAIVDSANAGEPVLFLLDEILHGTNSRERHIGAKAVVLHLIDRGSIGAVSSHDLALADLAEVSSGRIKTVHFEEIIRDDRMAFDYVLKPGVVTTTNALRLMRLVGLNVPGLDDVPDERAGSKPPA